MNDFGSAKKDYYQLIVDLNKSNMLSNKKTRLYFYIDNGQFFGALSEKQKVLLCVRKGDQWFEGGFSKYTDLEDFLVNFFKSYNPNIDLTTQILARLFQIPK